MTTFASTAPRCRLRPRQPAPSLALPLLGGGVFCLAERRPERFTMLMFFRGLHCPMCRTQLAELDRRLDELSARGVDVIAISAETRERSEQLQADWKRLDDLLHGIDYWTKVGYPARGDG